MDEQPAAAAAQPAATAAPRAATESPPVAWSAPPPEPGPAPGIEWAGYGARLIAYFIDGFILGVVFFLTSIVLLGSLFAGAVSVANGDQTGAIAVGGALLWFLVVFLVSVLYFPFFWANGGQTPGMRPFGIRVVKDADGSRVGWGTAFVRLIGLWVSGAILYLGFIWIFLDKRRRGWHDLIAGTVVVRDPNR